MASMEFDPQDPWEPVDPRPQGDPFWFYLLFGITVPLLILAVAL